MNGTDAALRPTGPKAALIFALVLALFAAYLEFDPVSLGKLSPDRVGSLFVGLVFVALVIERAVEVVVSSRFDDEEARLLQPQRVIEARIRRLQTALEREPEPEADAPEEPAEGAPVTRRQNIAAALKQADDDLRKLQDRDAAKIRALRGRKASEAAAAAIVIGVAVAAVGVRVIEGVAPDEAIEALENKEEPRVQLFLFRAVDVVLTAFLLAGGADGVHALVGDFFKRRKDLAAPG